MKLYTLFINYGNIIVNHEANIIITKIPKKTKKDQKKSILSHAYAKTHNNNMRLGGDLNRQPLPIALLLPR